MSILNKAKKIDEELIIEHVDAKPFFLSGIVQGFTRSKIIDKYDIIICFFKNGEVDWITKKSNQLKILDKMLEKELKERGYWKNQLKQWMEYKKIIEETYDELVEKDLSELNDDELIKDLERIFNNQIKTRRYSSIIDAFYLCGAERLNDLLKEEINEAFSILTAPEYESFLNRAKKELIEVKKGKKDIKEHVRNFSWIKTHSFAEGKEYGIKEAEKEIEKINENEYDVDENKKAREEFIKSNKLDREIIALSDLLVLFTCWTDLRKENSMQTTYLATRYLKEIACRKKIDFDELSYLYFPELKDFLKGKNIDFKNRKKGILFLYEDDKFENYRYDEIRDFIDKILNKKVENIKELKGMCASKGKAEGKAKILLGLKDMKKIKQGDILVAYNTEPEHLSAMKRAGAIIAEIGGITSHAAIVSRELKIPCIIGVKDATKVLKDNDLVEVDADKSVVRKL